MRVYTTITTITGMKEILPINFINAIAANTACNIAINNGKPKLKVIFNNPLSISVCVKPMRFNILKLLSLSTVSSICLI